MIKKPADPFTSNSPSDLKITDPVLNGVFTVLIKHYFIADQLTYLKFFFQEFGNCCKTLKLEFSAELEAQKIIEI